MSEEIWLEPREDLRAAAVRDLIKKTSDPQVQELLADLLIHDFSIEVQEETLKILAIAPQLSDSVIEKLKLYRLRVPSSLRKELLDVYARLPRQHAEALFAELLQSFDGYPTQDAALEYLKGLPGLSDAALRALIQFVKSGANESRRSNAARILLNQRETSGPVLRAVLEFISGASGSALRAEGMRRDFRAKALQDPMFLNEVTEMMAKSTSASVQLTLLQSFENVGSEKAIVVYRQALKSSSAEVRYFAAGLCRKNIETWTAPITALLMESLSLERSKLVRYALIYALSESAVRTSAQDEALLDLMASDPEVELENVLAYLLSSVQVNDKNRSRWLDACLKAFKEPFLDAEIKTKLLEKLQSFAYRDEPRLVECYLNLLKDAGDIQTVEKIYPELKRLAPDARPYLALIKTLFYRFVGSRRSDIIQEWLKEFEALAPSDEALLSEISYIAQLGDASWLLKTAAVSEQKSTFLATVLDLIRSKSIGQAEKFVSESWEYGSLRKKDMITLFQWSVAIERGPLLQRVAQIMKSENVVSENLVNIALDHLRSFPHTGIANDLKRFLRDAAEKNEAFRAQIVAHFNQANYDYYCQRCFKPGEHGSISKSISHWEYDGWRLTYEEFPAGELFADLAEPEEIATILRTPISSETPIHRTVQYFILKMLWVSPPETDEEYRALGDVLRRSQGEPRLAELADRVLPVFGNHWESFIKQVRLNPILEVRRKGLAPDLKEVAANVAVNRAAVEAQFVK